MAPSANRANEMTLQQYRSPQQNQIGRITLLNKITRTEVYLKSFLFCVISEVSTPSSYKVRYNLAVQP